MFKDENGWRWVIIPTNQGGFTHWFYPPKGYETELKGKAVKDGDLLRIRDTNMKKIISIFKKQDETI